MKKRYVVAKKTFVNNEGLDINEIMKKEYMKFQGINNLKLTKKF